MNESKLYHYEIGFPQGFSGNVGTIRLKYTRHALEESKRDRYGNMRLPSKLDTSRCTAVELEVRNRQVLKIVYRIKCTGGVDMVLVCSPDGSEFRVRTVWLNKTDDTHKTLNANKYDRP